MRRPVLVSPETLERMESAIGRMNTALSWLKSRACRTCAESDVVDDLVGEIERLEPVKRELQRLINEATR